MRESSTTVDLTRESVTKVHMLHESVLSSLCRHRLSKLLNMLVVLIVAYVHFDELPHVLSNGYKPGYSMSPSTQLSLQLVWLWPGSIRSLRLRCGDDSGLRLPDKPRARTYQCLDELTWYFSHILISLLPGSNLWNLWNYMFFFPFIWICGNFLSVYFYIFSKVYTKGRKQAAKLELYMHQWYMKTGKDTTPAAMTS